MRLPLCRHMPPVGYRRSAVVKAGLSLWITSDNILEPRVPIWTQFDTSSSSHRSRTENNNAPTGPEQIGIAVRSVGAGGRRYSLGPTKSPAWRLHQNGGSAFKPGRVGTSG